MTVQPLPLPPEFLVLDTETTGFKPFDRIIQLGIINQNGDVLMNQLLKPDCEISEGAFNAHGISLDMLQDSPSFADIYDELAAILNTGLSVYVYNADYDRRMLNQDCVAARRLMFSNSFICAMKTYAVKSPYRTWQPHRKSFKWFSLDIAASHWGIQPTKAHDAIGDCETTLALLRLMERGFEK